MRRGRKAKTDFQIKQTNKETKDFLEAFVIQRSLWHLKKRKKGERKRKRREAEERQRRRKKRRRTQKDSWKTFFFGFCFLAFPLPNLSPEMPPNPENQFSVGGWSGGSVATTATKIKFKYKKTKKQNKKKKQTPPKKETEQNKTQQRKGRLLWDLEL